MENDKNSSLTDDQMHVDFRSDPSYMVAVIRDMVDMEGRLKGRGDDEEVTVPVATMNRMLMGIRGLVKVQTELGSVGLFGDGNNRGDRGANCDYNPFSGINFGDL